MEAIVNQVPMLVVVILLAAGFVFLIKGADFFVEGSSSVARRFRVPSIVIGLTVVAMGTSLPETAVSLTASVVGNNELAVSNAVGSNIFNLLVVIGVCALFTSIPVGKETITRDIPFSAICAVLLGGLGYLAFSDASTMVLGHLDGIVFILIFIGYIAALVHRTLKERKNAKEDNEDTGKQISMLRSILYIIGGAAAIAFGGDLTVTTASRIAVSLGMSQTLVGLTIVSIGTSLPELVTSIVAARKKEIGMALGNAIGSNVFNILMVLGISSAISPISLITENIIDIAILLVATLIVWIFAASKKKIERMEGILMLLMYAAYTAYIFIR